MAKPFRKRGSRNYYVELWSGGRRRTLSLGTDNYGIAKAMVGKLEHDAATTGLRITTKSDIPALLARFAQHLLTHQRLKGAKTDIGRLREAFGGEFLTCLKSQHPEAPIRLQPRDTPRFALHAGYLEQVTTAMVIEFLTRLSVERGIGPKTWNEYRGLLHRLFSWAIRTQSITMPGGANPIAAVPSRRVDPPRITFLTLPQMREQLAALEENPQVRVMVAVYLYAGLRREELLWLTTDDVDLQRRIIHVRAKSIGEQSWRPKTNRNRRVPISSALLGILRGYVRRTKGPWYFPTANGFRLDPDHFSTVLRNLNKARGLTWSCGDFRHTFGTQLAMAGRDERTIAELMGNSPEIVRRHYAAWLPEAHPEAVEFDTPGGPMPMENSRHANVRVEAHQRGLRLVNE